MPPIDEPSLDLAYTPDSLAVTVLAAGEGRRFGAPKALARLPDGSSFLERAVASLDRFKWSRRLVVLGARAGEVSASGDVPAGWETLVNENWPEGQITSLRVAIRALMEQSDACPGLVVALVDHPVVRPETVRALREAFRPSEQMALVPTYGGRGGHPVVLSSLLFDDLLAHGDVGGAREVLAAYRDRTARLEVEDPGILKDVDFRSDLADLGDLDTRSGLNREGE